VPPSANSMSPIRRASAAVKAPRSWPKSSLSSRASGIAPQSTGTNGRIRPPAAAMDGPGHEFLARARLAGHEHVDRAACHPIDDVIHLLHHRALAEKIFEGIRPLHGSPQELLGRLVPRFRERPHEGIFEVGLDTAAVEVIARRAACRQALCCGRRWAADRPRRSAAADRPAGPQRATHRPLRRGGR